jgi:hypothetical protein
LRSKTTRHAVVICTVFVVCVPMFAQRHPVTSSQPTQFELGRHTFFDFGPPSDFYEIFVVRPVAGATSIERITLTPPGDACLQPAKLEMASAVVAEPAGSLLGDTNPCAIPEKELRRELKRCKKCLVFSGANIAMQVQCGTKTRIIRSDILDRDMFDPAANTPEHTSWTMKLLSQMDKAVGPGVMDRPIFSLPDDKGSSATTRDSEVIRDLSLGKYDTLFPGARDKPSDLYRAAQKVPPTPTVQLLSSEPIRPEAFVQPTYPPIARAAHVEGIVAFTVEVGPEGNATNFALISGHPMLRGSVEKSVAAWKFPKEDANQKIEATVGFKLNCLAHNQQ